MTARPVTFRLEKFLDGLYNLFLKANYSQRQR